MINAVIFDLDNTIYDYDICHDVAMGKLKLFACEKYSIEESVFEDNFACAKTNVKNRLGSIGASHNRMLYMQGFLENIGRKPTNGALELYEVYWNSMLDTMELFPYVKPLMDELQNKGISIAMLTDLTAHIQHRKIQKLGLIDYIDCIVTSEEAGQEKPSKIAFMCILDKLALPAVKTLMIGDSQKKDIDGAIALGINAMLYKKEYAQTMNQKVMDYVNGRMDQKQVQNQ